jgi:hypothetical protein
VNPNPKDWKTYDQFAYGIDTNRLPASDALAGSTQTLAFDDGRRVELTFAKGSVDWSDGKDSGTDKAEVVEVAASTYFVEIIFKNLPKEAETTPLNIIDLLDLMSTSGWLANIERGPGRHGISNAFFLYVRVPDGHRIEIYCSDYQTVDPDLEPIKWDLKDPQRQTLWGGRLLRAPGSRKAASLPAPRRWNRH